MALTKTETQLILDSIGSVREISQETLDKVEAFEPRITNVEQKVEETERIFDQILDLRPRIKKNKKHTSSTIPPYQPKPFLNYEILKKLAYIGITVGATIAGILGVQSIS